MIFNSIIYIFLFLPLSLIGYYITPVRFRHITLLILSLLFFSWGSFSYIVLMLLSVVFNYLAVIKMDSVKAQSGRKNFLTLLVTFNLLIIFVLKYLGFFVTNFNSVFGSGIFVEKLVQPLGISFYTFQVLSYVFDVYKKDIQAEKNPLKLALYFLMFPQLLSGPIMRYGELRPQMEPKLIKLSMVADGMERFVVGLFKKVFIANTLGGLWTTIKGMDPGSLSVLTSWVGIIAFTLYIYFDFSGYMDMALGTANMFGYKLQENFDFPYISRSVSEFWRRWHMTLGRWFRDYIYIPMGGSRNGNVSLVINTMTVWTVTGLWHGASWNFVIWGIYLGVVILLEKFVIGDFLLKLPKVISNIYTMIMIMIGWVLFDTPSLGYAGAYIKVLFGGGKLFDSMGIYSLYTYLVIFILAVVLSGPAIYNRFNFIKYRMTNLRRVILLAGLSIMFAISVAYVLNQTFSPSMYIGF